MSWKRLAAIRAKAPWIRWARVGMAALLVGVQLDGCASLTRGITIPNGPAPEAVDELSLTSLPPGTQVRIILRGDSLVSGKFRSVSRMEPGAYARRVAEFRAARTDSTPLPAPGSTIQLRRGSKYRAAFLDGFGYRSLELRWKKSRPPDLLPFDDFTAVTDSSGHVWTRDALDTEMIRGRLPCFTLIEVETELARRQVPADQVMKVAYRTPSGRWVSGALVVVGLVAIILVIASQHHREPTGPQCEPAPGTFLLRNPGVRALTTLRVNDLPAKARAELGP